MLIILTVVTFVLAGLCLYGLLWGDIDSVGFWAISFGVVVGTYAGLLAGAGTRHFLAEGEIAKLNEMRRMVSDVGPNKANMEDVYGEAAKLNLDLAVAKRYNQMFVLDPWIPDKYADQEPIALPSGSSK